MEDSGLQIGWALIKHQREIQEQLRSQQQWEQFQDRISQWRDQHLNASPFPAAVAAQTLTEIVEEFGLDTLLEEADLESGTRTRAVVRTRGPRPPGRTPRMSLEDQMKEVARLFGNT